MSENMYLRLGIVDGLFSTFNGLESSPLHVLACISAAFIVIIV